MKKAIDDYFQRARSWFDDVYVEAVASRNRYRFAFFWSMLIISISLIAFILLLPLQHTQLILVHHMDDGTIWMEPVSKQKIAIDQTQIESDLVRYIVNRESYSPFEYEHQYTLVNLLSNEETAKEYGNAQSVSNPEAPINHFKHRIIRSVHVQNIIYLNKNSKQPLAQVNFVVTDRDRVTSHQKKQALLALVSWKYHGSPKDPTSRWLNWDGFTVTHYSVQQRNI